MKEVTDPNILAQLNSGGQLKEVSNPELLSQLNGQQPEKSLWQKTKDAWTGQTEYPDAGNAQDWVNSLPLHKQLFSGMGWRTATADVLGNDEDVENAIIKSDPTLKDSFFNDKFGNRLFKGRDGTVYHVNTPGASISDTISGIGNIGSYAVGGMLTGGVKNLAARTAATGGTEAGINAINQTLSGRDEIDKGESLISGLIGGGFELAKPIVSKVWRAVKNSKAGNKQAGKMLADELGAENLTNEQLEQLGYYVNNLDDSVTNESMLSHVELGQKPTRGSLSGDQLILDRERFLSKAGRESTVKKLELLNEDNQKALNEAFLNKTANPERRYVDTASMMGKAVRDKEKLARETVKDAYDIGKAYARVEPFDNLEYTLKKELSMENIVLAPSNTPRALDALNDVSAKLQELKKSGGSGVSWRSVDNQKKRIDSFFKGASDSDKKALTIIKNKYNDIAFDAFENELFSGSPDVASKLKNARSIATDYFSKFKEKGKYNEGKIIQKWLDKGISGERISNAIFNTNSGSFKIDTAPLARKYLSIVGKNSPEHDLLKELAIKRLFTDKTKESMRNSLKNALTDNPTVMNEIFNKKELGFMSRSLHFLSRVTAKGDAAKSSGTTERLFRWLTQRVGSDVSLSNILNSMKKAADIVIGGERGALSLPYQQIPNNSVMYNILRGGAIQEGNE